MSKTIVVDKDVEINFSLNATFFLQEGIDVRAVRADKKTPTTYSNITAEEIEGQNYGQDLPYLLESMPGECLGETGWAADSAAASPRWSSRRDSGPMNQPRPHFR